MCPSISQSGYFSIRVVSMFVLSISVVAFLLGYVTTIASSVVVLHSLQITMLDTYCHRKAIQFRAHTLQLVITRQTIEESKCGWAQELLKQDTKVINNTINLERGGHEMERNEEYVIGKIFDSLCHYFPLKKTIAFQYEEKEALPQSVACLAPESKVSEPCWLFPYNFLSPSQILELTRQPISHLLCLLYCPQTRQSKGCKQTVKEMNEYSFVVVVLFFRKGHFFTQGKYELHSGALISQPR